MRRADRLFRIVGHLGGGRMLTARQLAQRCEVSERTIYRDVADLAASGVPIEGAAGLGYALRPGFQMPPLMLTAEEAAALAAGARMLAAFGGPEHAAAASDALVKVEAVLPPRALARARDVALLSFGDRVMNDERRALLDRIDRAAAGRLRLGLHYRDQEGRESRREVRPFGLWFWGASWTLAAWCEAREDWRLFRVDRIEGLAEGARFRPEPGRDRAALLRHLAARRALRPGS